MSTNRPSSADLSELYYQWLGIPVREQPANHYRLLGLALFEHNPNVIEGASDRQMSHVRSFATGSHSLESQQILNELSKAKLCLLNDRQKAEYDAGLRSRLAGTPMGGVPLAQIPAPVFPVLPREPRQRPRSQPTSTPAVPSSVPQRSPPKSALHTFVWGALGIVALVILLMFLTHVAHLTITALKDERNEDLPVVSSPPKAEPSPTTSTVSKSSSQTKVATPAREPTKTPEASVIPGGESPTPPPIAWFKAENNVNDSAGSHNGTLQGESSFSVGKNGQAFQLDSKSGYVQVPDSPDWDFGSSDFTIVTWVNLTSVNDRLSVIVAHDDGPFERNKWIYCYDGNTFAFHINDPASASTWLRSTPFALNVNQWYKVAVSRRGNTFTFFVDGIAIGTATSERAIPSIAAPLTLGWAEKDARLHGLIDETKIYNRALSAAEVSP